MTVFTINHDLWIVAHFVINSSDAFLQIEHHRASGIDQGDVVASRRFISGRRFAVSTEQHAHIVQFFKGGVVNHHQPTLAESFALTTIVHNVAKAIENFAFGELIFGFLDGAGHTKAEARARVDFDM